MLLILILQEYAAQIQQLINKCKHALPPSNQLFSIEVDEKLLRKSVRPEVLREFIHDNRKYRDNEKKNKWTTTDSMQRSNWYSLLIEDQEIKDKIKYLNEINCSQCEQVVDRKWSRCVIGGFYYCEE